MENIIEIKGNSNISNTFRLPVPLIKLIQFEYWPTWAIFLPSIFYAIYLAFKSKSLTYFTAANPGIELGGFFGESKINILNKINSKYLPGTFYFEAGSKATQIESAIKSAGFNFPVICKPDKGERGFQVEKVDDLSALKNYLLKYNGDLIVQEFIDYNIELGILYYRYPNGNKSGITSIVMKEFLAVTGDGVHTVEELIDHSEKARVYKSQLSAKNHIDFNMILGRGQKLQLEQIGNHCRGTKFLNGGHLINEKLVSVFDEIAENMDGFNFGRFDLKVSSIQDLYAGSGIKIMEVNGTTSEPGHIYDPIVSYFDAQKSILENTKIVYEIAKQHHQNGVKYTSFFDALRIVRTHFKNKKQYGN